MTTDVNGQNLWVVGVGCDFNLWYNKSDNGQLDKGTSWQKWGGSVRHEPSVCQFWDGSIDVFYVDAGNGHLMQKYSKTASPTNATDNIYDLGGVCAGSPVSAYYDTENKRISVFVVGMDGQVYQCYWNTSKWIWSKLSLSPANKNPAFQPEKLYASSDGKRRIDLVAVGVNNGLYHRFFNGNQWSDWIMIGQGFDSRPVCVTMSPTRVDIVAKDGSDHTLYHTANDNGVWLGWQQVSTQQVMYDPAIAYFSQERFDIVVAGVNSKTYHNWNYINGGGQGKWRASGYEEHGSVVSSEPKIAVRSGGKIDMFHRGMSGSFWWKYWDGSKFNGWINLGGILQSKPC